MLSSELVITTCYFDKDLLTSFSLLEGLLILSLMRFIVVCSMIFVGVCSWEYGSIFRGSRSCIS